MRHISMKIGAALALVTFGFASPAAAATRVLSGAEASISPWVALSALGSSASSSALCGASVAAASSAAAQAAPGCVLPVVDAPPAPVVETPVPVPVATTPVARGFSILPLLLGLVGVAAIAALLLGGGDDDDDINVNPITQP